jgi:16S rRNA (cytidine1402-2'-O)-methyltransferase
MSPGSFPKKENDPPASTKMPASSSTAPNAIIIFPIFQRFLFMTNKGRLILIPNAISEDTGLQILAPQAKLVLPGISYFLVENVRSARRFLSSLKVFESIEPLNFSVLDKDTKKESLADLMSPLLAGHDMGVISESGCPGVADPGSIAVEFAHRNGVRVMPLVGPSSILLALMGSGLNGQKFAFHGYLPIDAREAAQAIKDFEKESKIKRQTQIFIETPYRNNSIYQLLIKTLSPATSLTIAIDLTGPQEAIRTSTVAEWRKIEHVFPKLPAVFLFLI